MDFYKLGPGEYEQILDEYDVLIFSDVEAKLFQLNACGKYDSDYLIFLNAEIFSTLTDLVLSTQKPGEMNSEIPAGEQYCLITCANGQEGCLSDSEQYRQGGYEVETAHVFYDSFRTEPGSLEKLASCISDPWLFVKNF